jgi:hypothetical protein
MHYCSMTLELWRREMIKCRTMREIYAFSYLECGYSRTTHLTHPKTHSATAAALLLGAKWKYISLRHICAAKIGKRNVFLLCGEHISDGVWRGNFECSQFYQKIFEAIYIYNALSFEHQMFTACSQIVGIYENVHKMITKIPLFVVIKILLTCCLFKFWMRHTACSCVKWIVYNRGLFPQLF